MINYIPCKLRNEIRVHKVYFTSNTYDVTRLVNFLRLGGCQGLSSINYVLASFLSKIFNQKIVGSDTEKIN